MKAVLWDMDGTLVDSEKLWDVSLAALYEKLGGELTPAVRASIVGSVAENTMRIIYTDLGLELDPAAMSESIRLAQRLHREAVRRWFAVVRRCEGVVGRARRRRYSDGIGHQHTSGPHRQGAEQHWPPVLLGHGLRRRGAERQTRAGSVPARSRLAGLGAGASAWPSRTRSPEPRRPSAPDARCWWCPTMSRCRVAGGDGTFLRWPVSTSPICAPFIPN